MLIVPFKQVDVFTHRPFAGNPVAVVLDGQGLDPARMQAIAHWTNLSETAFILPPTQGEASYRVRIFTPRQELPFAGHPSVGAAHAVLELGLAYPIDGRLVQECAAGLLPVSVAGDAGERRIAVRAPQARALPTPPQAPVLFAAAAAGLPHAADAFKLYDNGPRWWTLEVAEAAAIRAHLPNLEAIAALTRATGAVGLAVYAARAAADHDLVVRAWCPADGIPEDPVTGSVNACIGARLLDEGRRRPGERYVASQGREVGRDGRVEVRLEADGVWIGGQAVTVVDGMVRLD